MFARRRRRPEPELLDGTPRRPSRSGNPILSTILPILLAGAVIGGGSGTVAVVRYTESPQFCTTCHEMGPYHDAWAKGPHRGVSCIRCHVDPGTVAEYTHKVSALKEVYDHLTAKPKFPRGDAVVPDARCIACHKQLPATTASGFPHASHVGRASCASCHPQVGHKVDPAALAKAGVLSPTVTSASAETSRTHVTVTCSKCHDMVRTTCRTCHTPPHEPRGECVTCHSAGTAWTFAHPDKTADCATCHERPKNHFAGACSTCHDHATPFAKTVYAHTDPTCASCHAQPADHVATNYACTSCHKDTGKSWAFTHPDSPYCTACHAEPAGHFGSDCAGCHTPATPFKQTKYTHTSTACSTCHHPPANHYHAACSTCHTPAVPFAQTKWTHPTSTTCAGCHARPSGHHSGSCYTCHKNPGKSWAFSHPGSRTCTSCHAAPSNHFGNACASCHTPSIPFASTKFNHPATHHDYLSRPCASCHPSGPPAVSCTCHGGGTSGP